MQINLPVDVLGGGPLANTLHVIFVVGLVCDVVTPLLLYILYQEEDVRTINGAFVGLSSVALLTLDIGLINYRAFGGLAGGGISTIRATRGSRRNCCGSTVTRVSGTHCARTVRSLAGLHAFCPAKRCTRRTLLSVVCTRCRDNGFRLTTTDTSRFVNLCPSGPRIDCTCCIHNITGVRNSSRNLGLFGLGRTRHSATCLHVTFTGFRRLVGGCPGDPCAPSTTRHVAFVCGRFTRDRLDTTD